MTKVFRQLREELNKDKFVPKITSDDEDNENRGQDQKKFVAKHVTDFFKANIGMEAQFKGTMPQVTGKVVGESEQRDAGDENVENFIKKKIKEMGKDSLDDLTPEEKKKLFNAVDKEFKADNESITEEADQINENILSNLKNIVKSKKSEEIEFKNGKTLDVDQNTANLIVSFHDQLKPSLKTKFESQLERGPSSFLKVLDLATSTMGK